VPVPVPPVRGTDRDPAGLTPEEAADRLRRFGPNRLPAPHPVPLWRRVVRALGDPLVLVLLAAMALTVGTGDHTDALVITLVVLVNTTLGVRQELTADRAVRLDRAGGRSGGSVPLAGAVTTLRDDRGRH
jgi:P-type Ca2+ transporter type 2C